MHERHLTPAAARVCALVPAYIRDRVGQSPLAVLAGRVVVLLAVYAALDWFVLRAGALGEAAYHRPVFSSAFVDRLGPAAIAALLAAALLAARNGSLLVSWPELERGRILRWFVGFLALLIAWPFTTYGFNYYFGHTHALDRALIGVLAGLIFVRPVFVFPFVLLASAAMWQLTEPPLGGPVLAHKLQVLHVLNLFGAALAITAVTGSRRTDMFVFLVCCMIAGSYWVAGYAKLVIGWHDYGHLYRILFAAHAHGWLAHLPAVRIVELATALRPLDRTMQVAVLVVECGCLLFLLHRRVSGALLVGVMAFHVGVFVLYGYCFWTWFALDAALFALLVTLARRGGTGVHGHRHFVLSVPLIALAAAWANPPQLAWFDTQLSYVYRFEATDESGRTFELPVRFFEPYGDSFAMSPFYFLGSGHAYLVGAYGITKDAYVAHRLDTVTRAEDVLALEEEVGVRRHHPGRAADLEAFLVRFVSAWNEHGPRLTWLNALAPPPQFWSSPRTRAGPSHSPIVRIDVHEVTTLFDGASLREIRDIPVATVHVPPAHAAD